MALYHVGRVGGAVGLTQNRSDGQYCAGPRRHPRNVTGHGLGRKGNPTGVGPGGTERDAVRACGASEFVVSRAGGLEGVLDASRGGCGSASAGCGVGQHERMRRPAHGGLSVSGAPGSVVPGQALIERVGSGGRVVPLAPVIPEGGRVDREQLGLRRAPCRTDRGRVLRDTQVSQDGPDDDGVGEEGEDAHLTVAGGATEGVHLVDPREQLCPPTSGAAVGCVAAGGAGVVGGPVGWVAPKVLTPVAGGLSAPRNVRAEDAVVAVPVDAGRWNQAREPIRAAQGG